MGTVTAVDEVDTAIVVASILDLLEAGDMVIEVVMVAIEVVAAAFLIEVAVGLRGAVLVIEAEEDLLEVAMGRLEEDPLGDTINFLDQRKRKINQQEKIFKKLDSQIPIIERTFEKNVLP